MIGPFNIDQLTPEQQKNYRLEGIFMPEARRQRDKLYKKDPDPKFVHYIKAEAALDIINQKRLWLRNTTSMADYREVHHGFQLLQNFFREEPKRKTFIEACNTSKLGAATRAIELFDQWWANAEYGIPTRTYIASISEHDRSENQHGRLSMWRAFGANAPARVAMVLKLPPMSGAIGFLNCSFSPVAYLSEEQVHAVIHEVIDNVQRETEFLGSLSFDELVSWLFATLVAGVTCLKREGFIEEREWRVIYSPGQRTSPLIEEEIKTIGGVPQVIYKLPIDKRVSEELAGIDLAAIFDSLIIGPSSQPWVMYEAFTRALKSAGIVDARVLTSGIPIRSL